MARAEHVPFTPAEVRAALACMPTRKTCGVSLYSADMLRGARDEGMYRAVARMFDFFATWHYPSALNRLLLMPLYKGKGDRLAPVSYRPISLIPPLGRWYATCLNRRLEATTRD